MVRCFKTKKENAQEARKFITSRSWANDSYRIGRSGRYVLIPIAETANQKEILDRFRGSIEERNLQKVIKRNVMNLKEALRKIVPADKIEQINCGFEAVGDIAVMEVPDDLVPLEVSIAWTLKRMKKNVNVVAKKSKKTSGKYRIRKVKVLVGDRRTETLHKESGVRIKTDLNKAYFSARMGSERLRILRLLKPKESILIMFSGVGPYGLVFAKHKPDVKITMIEWNPSAVKLTKENLKLNKLEKQIKLIRGDVRVEVPRLKERFERIVMVLPSGAHEFLKEALLVAKKGATIHVYQFEHQDNIKRRGEELRQMIEKLGKKVVSIKPVRSGYYSPKVNRYCYDIKID